VNAGTKVYWPDGTVAGEVAAEKAWLEASLAERERYCIERLLGDAADGATPLVLCFDHADVEGR
jgi:hypothetical protein